MFYTEYTWFNWEEKISLLPRRCMLSGKRLWFKTAMKGTRMITGPGDPVIIYKWIDKKVFLLESIKGTM